MKFTAALSLTMALAAASEQYYGHDSHHDSHRGHGDSYGHDSYSAPSGYVPADTTYAKCMIKDPEEEAYVGGAIYLSQEPYGKTNIWGSIWGLSPGKHGFHVHELGDLRSGCASLAGHWMVHGNMVGDLDEAVADKSGDAVIEQSAPLDLYGDNSIIGRSMVVHKKPDGNDPNPRVACCTIGLVEGPKKSYSDRSQGYGY